jgi:DNA-binding transcriptional LysR family regulator
MELYQLRTFAAVADEGHLTRAAERLHLSQPAVSAHIKALEDDLGVALFDRSSSGMSLTRAGRKLIEHAERVLAAAGELRYAARAFQGEISGHVRLGTVSDPEFLRLGEFLGRLVEQHPGLEIELRQEVSGAALEAVRTGELDASFYFGEVTDAAIRALALCEIAYRVVAPAAWSARLDGARWDAMAALPWIVTPEISSHRRLMQALFDRHGATPAKVVEADNEAVIANLVGSGVGLSLLREDLAEDRARAGARAIWQGPRPTTNLWFVYRAERKDDPILAALKAALADAWRAQA